MTSTITDPKIGDKVSVNHPQYPGVWTIERLVSSVNVVLRQEGRAPLKCPRSLLTEPGAELPEPAPSTYFIPGEFVRITSGKFAGLYIVTSDRGGKTVSITKPGGDGGRYVRAGRAGLVKVDPADVLK